MDKNNDIQVNKISKWDAAPESIGKLKHDLRFLLNKLEVRTYDVDDPEYKELVDEIFKGLDKALDDYNELEAKHNTDCGLISEYEEENKNLKSKLDIMTDENYCLIARVFKQDEEYTKLNEELYEVKKEREDLVKKCAELEKENAFNKKMQTEYCDIIEARLNQQYHKSAWQKVRQSKYKSKDDALRKMIKEVTELEKENKELKDTLEKDMEFGKNVGNLVADSIREGCDKGVYKLQPCTRIDIHVEETNNMPMTFARHAIPRIAVMFNNTQTEMERDTAQHECEELNEKVDRLWRVNEELNRKIKGLEKETNKSLSCPVACECENFKPKVHHSYDPLDDLPDMEHS